MFSDILSNNEISDLQKIKLKKKEWYKYKIEISQVSWLYWPFNVNKCMVVDIVFFYIHHVRNRMTYDSANTSEVSVKNVD